jgi:hypothetical protein
MATLLVPLLVSALVHPGCGGGSVVGPGKGERSVIDERGWALEPFELLMVDIDLTGVGNGSLDATVEWTFASDDVDLYATAQSCTLEMFEGQRCGFKAKADGQTTKPERLSFDVAAGDRYRYWIVNFGPQRESGTFAAFLTQD